MSLNAVRHILIELGVAEHNLAPDRTLRSDLALDSTETTELELALVKQFDVRVDLWDKHDYTLAELGEVVTHATSRASGEADQA
jgi:acyl carrier protein